jgi:glycosyltransferase involved in cell wall biosynthesis
MSIDTHRLRPAAAADVSQPRIAILIPCYNEELTIRSVVSEFRQSLPDAEIYVFDNNSSDHTVDEARAAGADVVLESRQGKGFVVQSMFSRIDADIYVMIDGDGTYPVSAVHSLIAPIAAREADMVIGSRLHSRSNSDFRFINKAGNYAFLWVLKWIFGVRLSDLLSGYRSFSRRLVRGMPLFGGGFETEVEMTMKTLQRGFRIVEVPVNLISRPAGSESKIRIVRDGILILSTMLGLFRDYKPLSFFGGIGLLLMFFGLIPGALVLLEYERTGLVQRLPSAILATALVLAGMITMVVGLILHTIAQRFREVDQQLQVVTESLRQVRRETIRDRTVDDV